MYLFRNKGRKRCLRWLSFLRRNWRVKHSINYHNNTCVYFLEGLLFSCSGLHSHCPDTQTSWDCKRRASSPSLPPNPSVSEVPTGGPPVYHVYWTLLHQYFIFTFWRGLHVPVIQKIFIICQSLYTLIN